MLPFQNDNITELDITELDVQYFKGVLKSRGDCKEHPYRSASTNFPGITDLVCNVLVLDALLLFICVCVCLSVCMRACMYAGERAFLQINAHAQCIVTSLFMSYTSLWLAFLLEIRLEIKSILYILS